jgi:peroxiredoxin Q/BCP
MLKEKTAAPDFKLVDSDGNVCTLSALEGNFVVVYFYPKDATPGCTKEACDFRDNFARLTKNKCLVFGISKDGVASHQKFKNKYELNFTLLSDPTLETHEAYQVLDAGKVIRSTFLIDKKGTLVKVWSKVKVPGHVEEVLKVLEAL